ncbi:hypothetical protein TNCV_815781 [Trichonephila clavipes]|nr:hypothetical protein TNCV_815781 [Trichonephila clavipes]
MRVHRITSSMQISDKIRLWSHCVSLHQSLEFAPMEKISYSVRSGDCGGHTARPICLIRSMINPANHVQEQRNVVKPHYE